MFLLRGEVNECIGEEALVEEKGEGDFHGAAKRADTSSHGLRRRPWKSHANSIHVQLL